jgi:hypothetical protein
MENELKIRVRNLSMGEIDRELAEISLEISFLEEQVESDLEGYSKLDLDRGREKISILKRRSQIYQIELERRKNSKNESSTNSIKD